MKIVLQAEVLVILLITIVLCSLVVVIGKKIGQADPLEKPKGLVLIGCSIVEIIDGMVLGTTSPSMTKKLGPYIGTIALYLVVANLIGLLGLSTPTSNYSVTLTLAAITWVMIQTTAIKSTGLKAYIHGFFEPIIPFVIPNFFGKVAPLISMSLRLFGNLLSGMIIMTLVYQFTGWLSTSIVNIFFPSEYVFNFIGIFVAPVLHAYFDVFSGCIQMFIFITLTMVFIGNELPQE